MPSHVLKFLVLGACIGATAVACSSDGPTSLGPTDYRFIRVNNIPVTGVNASFTSPPWPELGYLTTVTAPVELSEAYVLAQVTEGTDSVQLTFSFKSDGFDGACEIGANIRFKAGTTGQQTLTLDNTFERGTPIMSCTTSRVKNAQTPLGAGNVVGTGTVTVDIRPSGDTTGRIILTTDLDFTTLHGMDDRPIYWGTASVQGSFDVELRRDGSAYSSGQMFKDPTNSSGSGSGASQFGLPPGVSSLSCANPMPAGYQCVTNSGGTVPVKFNVANFTNQWWVDPSAEVCIYYGRSSGRATMRAQTGFGGGVVTATARFGVLVRANGTPIPDNNNWYVVAIPEPGSTWDTQWQLLTFATQSLNPWIGQSLQRYSACPW